MAPRDLGDDNPLLTGWRATSGGAPDGNRDRLIRRYSFAVPDERALGTIADASPMGVIEIGAGNGYWARLLHDRGVDVVAFDIAPAPSVSNRWFSDVEPWFEVGTEDHEVVERHPTRSLLMVWPTRDEDWSADALTRYGSAGGSTVLYVGEAPGGRTGDDRFHALLGEMDRCWGCAYGVPSLPCVCGVVPLFDKVSTVALPHWAGVEDDLHVYRADSSRPPLTPNPVRPRGHVRGWWR